MAMRPEHKELVKHLRRRIQVSGIKARVRGQVICGWESIQVNAPNLDAKFTDDEQRTIRHIAQCNKLTRVQGQPIDVERMTDPHSMNFYLP